MAKPKINEKLLALVEEVEPANPVLSGEDKRYLRGLKRRGYSEQQIFDIVKKAGLAMPPDFFKPRQPRATQPVLGQQNLTPQRPPQAPRG